MWWSETRFRFFAAATAALLILSASGCGFRPLYGKNSAGEVEVHLSQVKIAVIPDRVGQQVHNYLLDRINRKGRPSEPLYLLTVSLEMEKVELGIERDETATRAKLVLTASFQLQDIRTEEVLLKRFARSNNSYNIVDSAVATRSAELDAIDRAARDVSEEIRLMLALYFRRANTGEKGS